MEVKIPKRLTDWVSNQVDSFEDSITSLEEAFLSTITADECEGSGFVIKVNISPMSIKKETKGKGKTNPSSSTPHTIECGEEAGGQIRKTEGAVPFKTSEGGDEAKS